jgi:MEMO1 family protein
VQRVAPRARVLPVIGSRMAPEEIAAWLDHEWGGPETVIVISSDLSHFEPYLRAAAHDRRTVDRILAGDSTLSGHDACGAIGINGLVALARARHLRIELVDLCNSGDTAGGKDEVVGYGAFALYEEAT